MLCYAAIDARFSSFPDGRVRNRVKPVVVRYVRKRDRPPPSFHVLDRQKGIHMPYLDIYHFTATFISTTDENDAYLHRGQVPCSSPPRCVVIDALPEPAQSP